jgi:hypothetical protein
LGAANTWTLITLPNLPVFPATGFGLDPGFPPATGYFLSVQLAYGTSNVNSVNDVWVNQTAAAAPGAIGMSNFSASPVGSTFDLAFVQHQPGPLCTTLIDKPFSQNYAECIRYYSKTYSFGIKAGTAAFEGANATFLTASNTSGASGYGIFPSRMAKPPNVTVYNPNTGAANSAYDSINGANVALTGIGSIGDTAFLQLLSSAAFTAGHNYVVQYINDTGW